MAVAATPTRSGRLVPGRVAWSRPTSRANAGLVCRIRRSPSRWAHGPRRAGQHALEVGPGDGVVAGGGPAGGAQDDVARDLALDQVVLGARLDGFQAQLLLRAAREHDDGRLGRGADDAADRVDAVAVGQPEVEQHAVEGVVVQHHLGGGERLRVGEGVGAHVGAVEHHHEPRPVGGVVLHHQQVHGAVGVGAAHRVVLAARSAPDELDGGAAPGGGCADVIVGRRR